FAARLRFGESLEQIVVDPISVRLKLLAVGKDLLLARLRLNRSQDNCKNRQSHQTSARHDRSRIGTENRPRKTGNDTGKSQRSARVIFYLFSVSFRLFRDLDYYASRRISLNRPVAVLRVGCES